MLLIAASDWVCVRPGLRSTAPALADAFPPSGQEAAKSKLVDVLSRATEKLSIDWPDEPRESQSSKLDERFLRGPTSRPEWRKLQFFSDLLHEISRSWKQPFSSRLTNAAAADFTNLVVSVEQGYTAIPVVEDTLASHHLWCLHGSTAPSFQLNRVGPLPLSSGNPTLQLVRQAWPSTLWPSSKHTRPAASAPLSCSWPSSRDEESFHRDLKRQSQTVQTFLPASNTLSSLSSVTPTKQVLVCSKRPSSISLRVAVGRRIRLSPPTTCSFFTCGPRDGRHVRFSPTAFGPHTGHFSVHEQGRQGVLDTPTQVCLPEYNTTLPLSHFFHKWERLPGVSPWVLHTVRSGYTLQFDRNPPRFDGVHLTVESSASTASVLQQELPYILLMGAIEEVP